MSNIDHWSGARPAPRTGKPFLSMQNSTAQGAAIGVARNDYFQIASSVMAAAAVAALCLGKGAQAAAPLAVQELDSVVVAASRSETRVEDMPLHTTVITQEEIRQSPAQSLDQLLRNVPGFNFSGIPAAQSDPTGQSTKLRGLGNAKVLMLLDGVPIHDPFYLTTQWLKVPLSTIARVEIVRGGNSSLWGNMAVGGVVNIVTRRVTDNAGEVSLSAGNQGTSNVSAVKNFKVAGSFSNCAASSVKYYTNDQDGQSYGVELTGRWTVNSSLSLDASYTRTATYLTRRGSIVTDPLGVQERCVAPLLMTGA